MILYELFSFIGTVRYPLTKSYCKPEILLGASRPGATTICTSAATVQRVNNKFFFYPGMSTDLKQKVSSCGDCLAKRKKVNLKDGVFNHVYLHKLD